MRTFSLGALSLALPLLLKHRGLSAAALGGVLTATLVEDAVLTAGRHRPGAALGTAAAADPVRRSP